MRRYLGDRRGNISTMVALLIIPLVGVMGLAVETGNWYTVHRGAQNAADAAVIAAAQTGLINPGGTTYITAARSVSANLGYANGISNTAITTVNGQACPAPGTGSACYKVTVSRDVPINLIRILGYTGTGVGGAQTVSASALAGPVNVVTQYCILALGASGEGIRVNGGPNVDFSGCSLMSNSSSNNSTNCNGGGPNADLVAAVGTADPNCGGLTYTGATAIADPYSHYATDNPSDLSDPCGGVYAGQTWSSAPAWTPLKTVCGNLKLTTGTITIPSGTRLVIQNGQLDLNGNTLQGTGVTLVFNTPPGQSNIVPFASGGGQTGKGILDISAPTSGTWSGVALYQNRQNGSTTVVAETWSGNDPQWKLTGLVYFPYIDLTFKGIVSKSGLSCFALVASSLKISGNGAIYDDPISQCVQAGLVLPNNIVSSRVALLQ